MGPKVDKAAYISNRRRALMILENFATCAEELDDTNNIDYVQSKLEGLEDHWINFNEADEKVYELGDPSEYGLGEKPYYLAKSTFKTFLREHASPAVNKADNHDDSKLNDTMGEFVAQQKSFLFEFSQIQKGNKEVKLPRANIPVFRGDYKEWATFKDLFNGQIHENLRLSKATKFQYLKGSLADRAAKTIEHIPISDANYNQAWEKLCSRFEKKGHIANSYFQMLMDQVPATKGSVDQLRQLCDTSDEILRGLTALDTSTQKRDSLIIFLLLQKTFIETRRMWAEHTILKEFPSEEDFLAFLTKRCDALEMSQMRSTSDRNETIRTSTRLRAHTVSTEVQLTCTKCGNNHKLFKCALFQAMDVQPRREFVAEKSLCFNCLNPGHSSSKCFSPQRCHKCSLKHHTLLHINAFTQNQRTDHHQLTSCCTNCNNPTPSCSKQLPINHVNQPRTATNLNSVSPNYSSIDTALESSTNMKVSQSNDLLQASQASEGSSCLVTQPINPSRNLDNNQASLLPTAIILVQNKLGFSYPCRAMLDSGSQVSLITETLAQKLQISRKHARIPITGIAQAGAGYTRGSVQLRITSRLPNHKTLECQALVLTSLTGHTPQYVANEDVYQHIRSLPLADPEFSKSSQIDIILGAGEFFDILMPETVKRDDRVIAQNTIFGWIVCGKMKVNPYNQSTTSNLVTADIDVLLRQFWEVEELHPAQILTDDEKLMENQFITTHSRTSNGRYVVRLPFKPDSEPLGNSLSSAISRLKAMERKFETNSVLKHEYCKFMDEYLQLKHMKIVRDTEIPKNHNNLYYLPHHAVVKKAHGKIKLRVVFDGSAKTTSGVALNENLLVGATLQSTLFSNVVKFRKHTIAFASDIEKMYRQILVAPEDQDYQRIVWRRSDNEPIKHYKLQTVTYGLASSPYQAVRCLKQLANTHREQYPQAAAIVDSDFYVDDVMSGADKLSQAIECRNQLINLLQQGGFNLKKWKSNSSEFLQGIALSDQEISPLNLDEQRCLKVLGLQWDPIEDCLCYKIDLPENVTATKRELLSESSRLFDPLGLLAPSLIIVKVLFQSLWLLKLNWDDPLPIHIISQWTNFRSALNHLATIKIPRLVKLHKQNIELHGFSDASEKAYAAAVYFRSKGNTGTYETRLIAAKTKVAPIKQLSVPRLELCGALLVTKLLKAVIEAMCVPEADIFAWTDSTVVLQWLTTSPRKWKTFVSNRTSEILTILPQCHWKHVNSKENPSDHASRGVHPSKLKDLDIWWNGPEFLRSSEDVWKIPGSAFQSDEAATEEKSEQLQLFAAQVSKQEDHIATIILKYSSWHKLLRVFVYVFRFIQGAKTKVKNRSRGQKSFITATELWAATIELCRQAQTHSFHNEINRLMAGQEVSSNSKLASLHPYLDDTKILRVGGRLQNANITHSQKHPIILPGNHHITELIISDVHRYTLHGGTSIMLFHLRQQYWILGCRNYVKHFIHKCVICFKAKVKASKQLMGNLPSARVLNPKRAFENVGVDYAGPIMLKTSTIRNARIQKAYIALFVCMASKAVHLELVTDMTTEAFIAALCRFTARRGYPSTIYSDNGSNFVGADRELQRLLRTFQLQEHNDKVTNHLLTNYTQWKFMCPTASHMGGLYEAGIKSTKQHLRKCIGSSILTYEQYYTLLCQVEAVLNSRPLCSESDDINDLNYLTPGHFLIGEPLLSIPEPNLEAINTNRLSKWQIIQQTTQKFWKTFSTDYLNTLQQRRKWQTVEVNLKPGDLVVVIENNLAPTKWHVARVSEVHPGDDGLVRVATIKSIHGIFRRPIHKLAKLPIN